MNAKELAIINATAEGIAKAAADLAAPDGNDRLVAAISDLYEHLDRPLRSFDAGYYAAMTLAWKAHGDPDSLI